MNVLFVCTGNIFRSMSAEYLLRQYAEKNDLELSVRSAGTVANKQDPHPQTVASLSLFNIQVDDHEQTRVSEELLKWADVVVCMADYHQSALEEEFGVRGVLFNEVAHGRSTNVDDVDDVMPSESFFSDTGNAHVKSIVLHIHDSLPSFVENLLNRYSSAHIMIAGSEQEQ